MTTVWASVLKVAGRWAFGCRSGVVMAWRTRERRQGRRGTSWRSHGLERVAEQEVQPGGSLEEWGQTPGLGGRRTMARVRRCGCVK